jgi:hypothetical protein
VLPSRGELEPALGGAAVRGNWRGLLIEARLRRDESHAPVKFAVGAPGQLLRAAEMEIRMPRVADGPAAFVPFDVGDSFSLRVLGRLAHVSRVHAQRASKGFGSHMGIGLLQRNMSPCATRWHSTRITRRECRILETDFG